MNASAFVNLDFKLMADHSPFLIWVANPAGECIWFNKTWLDFTGRTLEEELGYGWTHGICDGDRDRIALAYDAYFIKRQSYELEYRLRYRNGSYRWILDKGIPLFSDRGEYLGYLGNCIDIHEKVVSNEKANNILETMQDSYWEWLPQKCSFNVSPQLWKMLGYDSTKKTNTLADLTDFIHPDDIHQLWKAFENYFLSDGTIPFHLESRFITKDGKNRWILSRGKIIERDPQGKVSKMIGTHTDIHDYKHLQSQILNQSRLVEIAELSAGIAHEINNPLTVINTRAHTLLKAIELDNLSPKKNLEGLKQIQRMSMRITKIVEGLKRLSRSSTTDPMVPLDFLPIFEESLELLGDRIKHNDIKIKLDYKIPTDLKVLGCSTQIMQVILNILNNACDSIAQKNERWINISATPLLNMIEIRFMDSGEGVDNNLLAKLFDPFFTTKEVGKGTGLGLSLSKKIIEHHQGELFYDQQSLHCTFVIRLPLAP